MTSDEWFASLIGSVKKAAVLSSFFVLAFITLISAMFLQYHLSRTKGLRSLFLSYNTLANPYISPIELFPRAVGEVIGSVLIHDARASVVERFLTSYNSPLAKHATTLVATSDKYGLDYRLLPSIAMQESGGGKVIPDNSYNAWGWGIHERGTLRFTSWDQSIETVARGIKRDYINIGLVTPEQIMTKYTPASIPKGGAWAKGVRFFMEQMP